MESINSDIKVIRNKIFSSNTYFLCNKSGNLCIIIDPGLDTQSILSAISESGIKPIAILSTHGHFDHIGCAGELQEMFKIPFYLHNADLKMSQSANFYLHVANIKHKIKTPKPDFLFKHKKEKIAIENFEIEVVNYPGHSNGSCVFRYNNYLFTGDILYKNGIGSESMPREDKKLLRESIIEIFTEYPEDFLVLPGHGASEYLGKIQQNNSELMNFISKIDTNG